MSRTPNRFHGEREDEGIVLFDQGATGLEHGDPPAAGGIRYVSDRFRLRDGAGVFNARTVFVSGDTAPSSTDDDSVGFTVGMLWLRQDTDALFVCKDSSIGAAVWFEITGIVGPEGPIGPTGPTGVAGYSETFDAASTWVVNHNLGRYPFSSSVQTLGGVEIDVAVQHVSVNQSVVSFDVPTAGVVKFT